MDLNQLLYHHQVALINVGRVPKCGGSFDMADHYAKRIAQMRNTTGAAMYQIIRAANER
ncbi:hypothetical protein [Croceicoccus pelagius]|uniref:Uncharacterized protein n=1 Tax=Croceicoccus pelagius TaxID=1703341 RepID=A0A917DIJ0_9SPHN|nr:hypothetical protein [Croceicoccus pelagius]GGD40175.1 hypothetical protein GCM10010989_12950 [Croceicoccus pelagius]